MAGVGKVVGDTLVLKRNGGGSVGWPFLWPCTRDIFGGGHRLAFHCMPLARNGSEGEKLTEPGYRVTNVISRRIRLGCIWRMEEIMGQPIRL